MTQLTKLDCVNLGVLSLTVSTAQKSSSKLVIIHLIGHLLILYYTLYGTCDNALILEWENIPFHLTFKLRDVKVIQFVYGQFRKQSSITFPPIHTYFPFKLIKQP